MLSPDGTSSSENFSTTSGAFALNTWYHIAFARDSSNNFRFFINGTQVGSTATNITSDAFDSTAALDLMAGIDGYMDECRISIGVCRFTSIFTAPTTAFKDDRDTVLLSKFIKVASLKISPISRGVYSSSNMFSDSGSNLAISV